MMVVSNGYSRVNFGFNALSGSRIQLFFLYNVVVYRMFWKGFQELFNSGKRVEFLMMGFDILV